MTRTIEVSSDLVGSLAVGELVLLEEVAKAPLSRLFSDETPRGPLLRALALIVLRREARDAGDDPKLVTEDDADAVRVVLHEEVGTTSENPTVQLAGRRKRSA